MYVQKSQICKLDLCVSSAFNVRQSIEPDLEWLVWAFLVGYEKRASAAIHAALPQTLEAGIANVTDCLTALHATCQR